MAGGDEKLGGRIIEVDEELASLRVTVNELREWLVVVVWRAIGDVIVQGRRCSGPLQEPAASPSLAHRYNSAWRRCVWWDGREQCRRRWLLECRIGCPSTALGAGCAWACQSPLWSSFSGRVTFRLHILGIDIQHLRLRELILSQTTYQLVTPANLDPSTKIPTSSSLSTWHTQAWPHQPPKPLRKAPQTLHNQHNHPLPHRQHNNNKLNHSPQTNNLPAPPTTVSPAAHATLV